MYDAVSCPPDSDLNFSKHAQMLSEQHLVRGARVHVLDGSHRNLVGQIIDISQSVATLWFSDQDHFSSLAIDSLALHFEQGDVVKITCGQHKDRHGRVRSIVDNSTSQSWDEANIVISLTHTSELVRADGHLYSYGLLICSSRSLCLDFMSHLNSEGMPTNWTL